MVRREPTTETAEHQCKKSVSRFFEQTVLAVAAKYMIVRHMVHSETVFNFQKLNTLRINALNVILFNDSMTGYDGFLPQTP